MKLSIVTTMYYSAPYIEEFYRRITNMAHNITSDYELIFVNDGSPDNSVEVVLDLYKKDDKVKLIDLSRNFGHHKAIMTGLRHSKGDYIFLIDCDLEEAPELLMDFWNSIQKNPKIDVFFGVQKKRKGRIFEKVSGFFFYLIFNLLSDVKIQKNLINMRIMTHRYVQALIQYNEYHPVIAGLFILSGFSQEKIYIDKEHKGKTTYNLTRKIRLFIDSIVSFSIKPLLFIFNLGILIMIISSIVVIRVIIQKLVKGVKIGGWTSLIMSVWFLGGLIVFSIGLVGIYLSKVYEQVKNRPNSIIKKIYETKRK